MATVTAYAYVFFDSGGGYTDGQDLTDLHITHTAGAHAIEATSTRYVVEAPLNSIAVADTTFVGADLTYDAANKLAGGVVTSWQLGVGFHGEDRLFSVAGLSVPATTFAAWIETGDVALAPLLLGGDDSITGSAASDTISGYAGNDTIDGGVVGDVLNAFSDNLLGGDGDDVIRGGESADLVNGNRGDDTAAGGAGDDVLRGGQGDDWLNGNVGDDTLYGDLGNDTVRGGQGDDVIYAGSGADWLAGDLGDNTLYGGEGLDTFRAGAGQDHVNGWHTGDQVQVARGVTWTIAQVNGDVHITFSNGGEMDLVNTQLASLPSGWIANA